MGNKNTKHSRGRPRNFDETGVLQRAALAFLKEGFEAASYEKIVQAMGLSKPSVYNAFGDKLALFERVLTGYAEQMQAKIMEQFIHAASLESATEQILEAAAEFYSSPNSPSKGCLLVGTGLQASSQHESIREILTGFTQSLEQSLEEAVIRQYAVEVKRLGKTPRQLALQISSLIFSLAVRAKMALSREELSECAKELATLIR